LGETIGENFRRTVERFGDRPALVVRHQNYRATYRELWEQVDVAARALLARGVRRGDRVGIWAPNRFEWVVVQFATARIGAILVNINPAYQLSELGYTLAQSGVSFLVLARGFRQSDYVALLEQVRPQCPELRETVVLDRDWDSFLASARG
jgi:fatty-acyl-CoA synthase